MISIADHRRKSVSQVNRALKGEVGAALNAVSLKGPLLVVCIGSVILEEQYPLISAGIIRADQIDAKVLKLASTGLKIDDVILSVPRVEYKHAPFSCKS